MTPKPQPAHSRKLSGALASVRRRILLAAGTRGVAIVGAAVIGVALLSLVVDRLFRLGVPARTICLAVYAGAIVWALARLLWRPLTRSLDTERVADLVERQEPGLEDLVRSAVAFRTELAGKPPSDVESLLKTSVVAAAEERAGELARVRVVARGALARSCGLGAGAALGVALVLALAPAGTASTWFRRNVLLASDVEWPYRTRLLVDREPSEPYAVPRGDPLELRVEVEGEMPDRAWITVEYSSGRRRFPLSYAGVASFRYTHAEVREPFRFTLEGGDYRSPPYRVGVLERPRLEELALRRVYPDYFETESDTIEEVAGDLAVPFGTTLELFGRSTKPLRALTLEHAGGRVDLAIDAGDRHAFRGELRIVESTIVTLRYTDVEGVRPDNPTRISIRSVPDRVPTVKLRAVGIGALVSPDARIPLEIDVSDDHPLARLELARRVEKELVVDAEKGTADADVVEAREGNDVLQNVEPDREIRHTTAFEVADHQIEPESRLALQVHAIDNDALTGPKTGSSATLEFRVVSHQTLMDDFLRRQEEQRRAFERVVETQRDLRDALYEDIDGRLNTGGELGGEIAASLLERSRSEKSLGTQSLAIAAALDAILVEMQNNRVGEADDLRRLGDKVIGPLRNVASVDLPALSAGFAGLGASASAADRVGKSLDLAEAIEQTLQRMDEILAAMAKLEGFTEVVNRLRSIIELQGESREAVKARYDEILQSVFEDEGIFDDGGDAGVGDAPDREGERREEKRGEERDDGAKNGAEKRGNERATADDARSEDEEEDREESERDGEGDAAGSETGEPGAQRTVEEGRDGEVASYDSPGRAVNSREGRA